MPTDKLIFNGRGKIGLNGNCSLNSVTTLTMVELRADQAVPDARATVEPEHCAVPSGVHIPALDGLRGMAILAVMAFHFGLGAIPYAGGLFSAGWAGVDLFFVLSGFLITGILSDARGLPSFFTSFYARRALRIFPLYFGVLAVVFLTIPKVLPTAAVHFQGPGGQRPFWLYYSNFAVYFYGWPAHPVSHFWSLAVEESSTLYGRL
jgi:peptidoglycan/LPS O-acetylase OafA/YrhL